MSGNGRARRSMGAYPVSGDVDMAAFDALPPPVRGRLRDAPVNVAAVPLRDFWMSGCGGEGQRIAAIQRALDAALIEPAGAAA